MRERWLARAWAAALLLFMALAAHADTAEITQLRFDRSEDGLLLSSTVAFDLPQAVDDALAKGIPMYFVAEAAVSRERWYWTDKHIATTARHMRLSYQPLTRRWRLATSSNAISNTAMALGQNFDSRDEALAAIHRISHWKIADSADLEADARYSVNFRFRLDVSQLPRPFQIGAVGQSDWDISAQRTVRVSIDNPR